MSRFVGRALSGLGSFPHDSQGVALSCDVSGRWPATSDSRAAKDCRTPRRCRVLCPPRSLSHFLTCLLLLLAGFGLTPTRAGVPEPDNIVWGSIILGTTPVTAANTSVVIEARRTPDGPAFNSYRMGTVPALGDRYSLRLAMEDAAPLRSASASLAGDHVFVVVRDSSGVRDTKEIILGGRGAFTQLDFGSADTDHDGLPDTWEQEHFGSAMGAAPGADGDGDGVSNLDEFHQGTNPLVADSRHPADNAPANSQITIAEVTTYGAAWKRGDAWPTGPQPGDLALINFVTRAGALWQGGEFYKHDTNQPSAPLWWVNVPPPVSPTSVEIPQLAAEEGKKISRHAAPVVAESGASFQSGLPARFLPGSSFRVTNEVNLPGEVRAYAVEQRVPAGWLASAINEAGTFDVKAQAIRWGPFFDGRDRAFTFQATAPLNPALTAAAEFPGVLSVDGSAVELGGRTATSDGPASLAVANHPEGVRLVLEGLPQLSHVIEGSSDLLHWEPLTQATPGWDGTLELNVAPTEPAAFYRVRAE